MGGLPEWWGGTLVNALRIDGGDDQGAIAASNGVLEEIVDCKCRHHREDCLGCVEIHDAKILEKYCTISG